MSLWEQLRRRLTGADPLAPHAEAVELERDGRLEQAATAFERAGEVGNALRVELLQADLATDAPARVRILGRALGLALRSGLDTAPVKRRYALARLSLATELPASARNPTEMRLLAEDLVSLGELDDAADALLLVGDHARAASILEKAGRIDRLESVLDSAQRARLKIHTRIDQHAKLLALESSGQRVAALALATQLAFAPDDEEAHRARSRLHSLLSRSTAPELEMAGLTARWLPGDRIVIGRADADIALGSPVVSRRHIELARRPDGTPTLRDLGTRNGTFLAQARLDTALMITSSLEVSIGGNIPVTLTPHATGGVVVEVTGLRYLASLGPAHVGAWTLERQGNTLRLVVPPGAPAPILADDVAAPEGVDLCVGDEIRDRRGGPVVLSVR